MKKLTESAIELFRRLAKDAGNWSGTPLFGEGGNVDSVLGYREDRGLLTHLKRAGLVTTVQEADGCVFVSFTDAGRQFAESLNIGWWK